MDILYIISTESINIYFRLTLIVKFLSFILRNGDCKIQIDTYVEMHFAQ